VNYSDNTQHSYDKPYLPPTMPKVVVQSAMSGVTYKDVATAFHNMKATEREALIRDVLCLIKVGDLYQRTTVNVLAQPVCESLDNARTALALAASNRSNPTLSRIHYINVYPDGSTKTHPTRYAATNACDGSGLTLEVIDFVFTKEHL